MKNDGRVSASEIGQFIYCKRGWWLAHKGLLKRTAAMEMGITKHNEQYLLVEKINVGKLLAIGFLVVGLVLIVIFYLIHSLF